MRVGALYAILRLETGAFHSALGRAESRWGAFGGALKAGGLIIGQALAVIGGASLKFASDFEQRMNEALAIMDGVTAEMRVSMEETARAIAKTSTFSATEAADAFFYLAGAGLNAEQSIAAMPVVTSFAQAGMMELEDATEKLMNAQSAMGMESLDAAENQEQLRRVADVLTGAQIRSTATLEQMSDALLNKAAPALRVVGKDIEEGAAVLAVFADQGLKGQKAGTALGIVMRELQTKAIKNKEEWAELGISVFDASGNMRHTADIMKDLEDATAGMSDEQIRATFSTLGFTDRSLGFIQTLMGTSDAIRAYDTALRDAGGTTEEIANKQLDTFQAQMTIAWHKIQDVGISIGQALLPGARDAVEAIGNWVDENHKLITTLAVGIFDALGKVAGLIGEVVGGAFRLIGDAIAWITDESNGLIFAIRGVMNDTEIFADEAGPLWEFVGEAVKSAIDIAEAAFTYFVEEVLPLMAEGFQFLIDEVLPVLAEAFQWFADEIMPILSEAFTVFSENVLPFFTELFRVIIEDIIPRLADAFNVIAETVIPALTAAFDFVATEVLPRIGAAFDWLRNDVIPPLQSIFEFVVSWFIANWPTISSVVGQVFGVVAEAFKFISGVIGHIVPIIWGIVQPIAAVLFPLVGAAASALLSALDIIFRGIGLVFDVFGDIATGIFRALTAVWEGLGGFFKGVWDEVSDVFKGGVNFIIDLINGFIGILNNIRIDIPRVNIPGTDIGVGGGSIDPFNIGTIPRLAKGTSFFGGGLAWVGENGPELAYLPHGAQVFPNSVSESMMNGEMTVRVKDDDGAIRAGRYDQRQIERVLTAALREMVSGTRHRSLRQGV